VALGSVEGEVHHPPPRRSIVAPTAESLSSSLS
jgi:hypothetical protein